MIITNKIKFKLKLFIIALKRALKIEFHKYNLKFNFSVSKEIISDYTVFKFLSDDYEFEEIFLAKLAVNQSDKILELGSGLGLVSMLISKNNKCEITSFDINEHLVELNNFNSAKNNLKNISYRFGSIINSADLSLDFYISNEILKSSFEKSSFSSNDKIEQLAVPCYKFDEIITETSANFLLIDIEGFESKLFNEECLIDFSFIDGILIELHPHVYGETEKNRIIQYFEYKEFTNFSSLKEVFYFKRKSTN